ncbi:BUB protein kinase [Emergomyces pasteurianus Ep9510]|uniref:BUB protein kinase n=1 Tax=Emergomyces pasteurianus Ep9510 TaxID=1447872 RepID=A0A1J9Q9T0_9EURO|nr:BUB protein kinase [Emergomyces pasteurianus Ep9510]
MAPGDLIDFDLIEAQKENVQSLPGGRSARALAAVLSGGPGGVASSPGLNETKAFNDAIRRDYELELQSIAESDDPLDIYDRYVKWTLDAYPSAQATAQSGLLPLLERATKAFLPSTHYKNDPRYLKLWLHYIRLFSDAPRETFAFLARHGIGESLALFYEEFAAWLEGAGRFTQAEEVYKLGLQREARPTERLLRKFSEFRGRLEQQPRASDEPSSPALPKVRPALAAKIDPFASATPSPIDPQAPAPTTARGPTSKRSGKPKMAIFSDSDGAQDGGKPLASSETKGWESIGSLQDRKKENTVEAKPWVGETLKSGKRVGAAQKMTVFKDETSKSLSPSGRPEAIIANNILLPRNEKETVNPRTGKVERVFVNLEAIYPDPENPHVEMSLEELRAFSRGWMDRDWSTQEKEPLKEISVNVLYRDPVSQRDGEDVADKMVSTKLQEELVIRNRSPSSGDPHGTEANRDGKGSKSRRLKVREVKGETQTIKTNLESPTGPKIKRKQSSEPTMTLHTRAATDEIYSIFNQPLKSEMERNRAESLCGSDYEDDDYTSAGESTCTGRISGTPSEFGEDETTGIRKTREESPFEEDETQGESVGVSEWTEFTASRHIPNVFPEGSTGQNQDITQPHTLDAASMSAITNLDSSITNVSTKDISTPLAGMSQVKNRFVPVPPEDYNAPSGPYRDAAIVAQNRLPFMTPIVEMTESSFGSTAFKEKKFVNTKTPSRKVVSSTPMIPEMDDLLLSSPFHEFTHSNDIAISSRAEEASPSRLAKKLKTSPRKVKSPCKSQIIVNESQCNPIEPKIREKILKNAYPSLQTYPGYHDHGIQTAGRASDIRKYIKAVSKTSKGTGADRPDVTAPVLCFTGANRSYAIKQELGEGGFAPVYLVESVDSPDTLTSDSERENDAMSANHKRPLSVSGSPFKPRRDAERHGLEAIKVESESPSAWEFYMLRIAHARIGSSSTYSRVVDSIIKAHEMHIFRDEGYLVEDYRNQGTLIDLINAASNSPTGPTEQGLDESVAMFFAVELFRTVEALHACGILHGDLKADNCLVRLDERFTSPASLPDGDCESDATTGYSPTGAGGWRNKGITLIDFGRGIDMQVFPKNVQFIADWKIGAHECSEMRECRPWTYQVDLYGLAGTIHILLFGKYMEVAPATARRTSGNENGGSSTGRSGGSFGLGMSGVGGPGLGAKKAYRIKESLKRYWEREIWAEVFDLCLNPHGDKWMQMERGIVTPPSSDTDAENGGSITHGSYTPTLPVLNSMKYIRERMEGWLLENAERKGLQTQLAKLERLVAK